MEKLTNIIDRKDFTVNNYHEHNSQTSIPKCKKEVEPTLLSENEKVMTYSDFVKKK